MTDIWLIAKSKKNEKKKEAEEKIYLIKLTRFKLEK